MLLNNSTISPKHANIQTSNKRILRLWGVELKVSGLIHHAMNNNPIKIDSLIVQYILKV